MRMMVSSEHLGGTAEVAQLLNCQRQQVYSLRKREDFPEPVVMLAATPVWDLRNVSEFKDSWVRRSTSTI